jgi:hypothetical protein
MIDYLKNSRLGNQVSRLIQLSRFGPSDSIKSPNGLFIRWEDFTTFWSYGTSLKMSNGEGLHHVDPGSLSF